MTALAVTGAISGMAADFIVPPRNNSIRRTENIYLNTDKSSTSLSCPEPLAANTRTRIMVRLPLNGAATFQTGRGQEKLHLVHRENGIHWVHTAVDGANAQARPYPDSSSTQPYHYWWENAVYTPNGRSQANFAMPGALLDWSMYLASVSYRRLDQAWFPVEIELVNGHIRWYFDHILLQDQSVTPEIHERKLQISFSSGVTLQSPVIEKIPALPGHFYPVKLLGRFNSEGPRPPSPAGRYTIDGIPFEIPAVDKDRENCVALEASWFREGNLTTYEAPNRGTFGGRWAGALSGNPARIQFRIPYRHYRAIYLLVSCGRRPDRVNRLTAQFYRPGSGFPVNCVPVEEIRTDGQLQLVRIPVRPEKLLEFADREVIELELTGDVHVHRAYPDPLHYSTHGAGIPSGVKVCAMTLESTPLKADFQPEAIGNIWTADTPSYRLTLHNSEAQKKDVVLKLQTRSYDEKESIERHSILPVPASGQASIRFDLPLEKYGWHKVLLQVDGELYERSLVILRPRSLKARKFDDPGILFGVWPSNHSNPHYHPPPADILNIAGPAGIDSVAHSAWLLNSPDLKPQVTKYGLKNFMAAEFSANHVDLPDLEEQLALSRIKPTPISEPVYQFLFAEPGGIGSSINFPEFFGEKRTPRTPAEQEKFDDYKRIIKKFAAAYKKVFPGKKLLMPWGDLGFSIAFLEDPETRGLFDGFGYDTAYFDRLPEQQLHQCSLHRMYQFNALWRKYREEKPLVVTCEGPCLGGVKPGALTADQHAAHLVRSVLILSAHGIRHFFASVNLGPEGASYWGEQHYGGGALTRIKLDPYPAYASQATMIRHLREAEFVKWVPTGSLSAYCLQYRHVRSGELIHVMWTIRGSRPVKMKFSRIFDSMDNPVEEPLLTRMPIYVYGNDGTLELGAADHSDMQLEKHHVKLGNAVELFPSQRQDEDDDYVNANTRMIRRFPAVMQLEKKDGGLAVTLPPQQIPRGTMPNYTTLVPEKPITIPGKAKYLTLEVTAASDWGRLVYVLHDANGEKWISVGMKNAYNCDDTPNASYFNFDGKRLVRFELPSHLPWDNFREMGTSWWGSTEGDGIVDLPLTLEKIFIERREKAMYVNSLEAPASSTVILGDLYAEYDSPGMMREQAMLKMPPPPVAVKPLNPIMELAAKGTLPASEITGVSEPDHYYDGTRGIFKFKEMPGAAYYDIYLSLSPDGTNALKLGDQIPKSGTLVKGFIADTEFHAFVVYYNKQGENSKPSPAFKFKLQDNFGHK